MYVLVLDYCVWRTTDVRNVFRQFVSLNGIFNNKYNQFFIYLQRNSRIIHSETFVQLHCIEFIYVFDDCLEHILIWPLVHPIYNTYIRIVMSIVFWEQFVRFGFTRYSLFCLCFSFHASNPISFYSFIGFSFRFMSVFAFRLNFISMQT